MFTQRFWALLAAVVCLAVVLVQTQPVADDSKADEMRIVAAMDEDLKPSTETPKEEPIMEPHKPKDLDTNHIQIIKMPSEEEVKEIIEELEEEIEKEAEIKEYIKEEVMKEVEEIEKLKEMKEQSAIVPVETIKVPEMTKPTLERSPRNMQMDELTSQKEQQAAPATSSLTDEDIDKIMKMISFPQTDDVEKTENTENKKTETEVTVEVEPRNENIEVAPQVTADESSAAKTRVGRAIRSEGKGYYILAFSPIEGPLTPSYTKFDIIPIERSVDGDQNIDDYDDETQHSLDAVDSDLEEGRVLTRKQFNHYIRKMMRQIRKGTRKIQRKTRLRSAVEEEPTVENFVRKWYATNKKAKAAAAASPQGSWFTWAQKA